MRDVSPEALDFSMFDLDDFVHLVLQRSDVLGQGRQANDLIRNWSKGYSAPLYEAIDADRLGYARAVAALIHAEYRDLEGLFARLAPRRIADIGCGYALFDLYAHHGFGAHLLLIDIETTESRHFGFADEGAGYASLATARAFLEANGVPADAITTWNPTTEDVPDLPPADLALSFLSCGFHYPVDLYLPYFQLGLTERGAVILDLRGGQSADAIAVLERLGKVRVLRAAGGLKRVLLKKSPAARGAAA